jgi:hypothetical protein
MPSAYNSNDVGAGRPLLGVAMIELLGTMIIIGVVVVAVLLIILFVMLLPKGVFHFMQAPLEARIAAHYRPDEILIQDLKANCFGHESTGRWQLRGNGALVLTPKQLHFFQFLPQSELRIPLNAITEVTCTKCQLGKATLYELFKVHFTVDGQPDSIAWYLTESLTWKTRIDTLKTDG